jgi:hypothetical protein
MIAIIPKPGRLDPPGICNQNANPPIMPDKVISTPKSIFCNDILDQDCGSLKRFLQGGRADSAEVCLSRCLLAGIVLFYGREFYHQPTRTGIVAPKSLCPVLTGTAQKEIDLIPKLNRMPDA